MTGTSQHCCRRPQPARGPLRRGHGASDRERVFGGRATADFDAIGDGQKGNDCHGHGTHVASIVGGTTYGVAKAIALHGVRVLDCNGAGAVSGIIAGIDFVTAKRFGPAVANMSLGGAFSSSLNNALDNSSKSGVFWTVAAGNEGIDACTRSPSGATEAFTVAASDRRDQVAASSNFGPCVDIVAPGVSIPGAWIGSDTAVNTVSGTSAAAPHAAGAAAMVLQAFPGFRPAEVTAELIALASLDVLTFLGGVTPADLALKMGPGIPNRLLHIGSGPPPPPRLDGVGARFLELESRHWIRDVALLVEGLPCDTPSVPDPCPGEDCPLVDCVKSYVQADGTLGATPLFQSVSAWGTIFVRGEEIVPDAVYTARAEDPVKGEGVATAKGKTYKWGDTNGDCVVDDTTDLQCVLDAFGGVFSGDCTPRSADLQGAARCDPPNGGTDVADIIAVVDALNGQPFPCPAPCGPGIVAVAPGAQRVYDFLELEGRGFGDFDPGITQVLFSDGATTVAAGTPYVWRDEFIRVRVPVGETIDTVATAVPKGDIRVKVETAEGRSNSMPLEILVRTGTLTFEELTDHAAGDYTVLGDPPFNQARTKDAEVADVDGDGWPDLVDNNSQNSTFITHGVVRYNNRDKTFTAVELEPYSDSDPSLGPFATTIPAGGTFIGGAVTYDSDLIDLTNDGLPEVVQALTGATGVRVLENDYLGVAGDFVEATGDWVTLPLGSGSPDDVDSTDVDHDGFVDVAIGFRFSSRGEIFPNDGGTTFAPTVVVEPETPAAGDSMHDVFFLDADADGFMDVVLVNESTAGASQLFLNNGTSPPDFSEDASFPSPVHKDRAGLAMDVDGDGFEDFALVGRTDTVMATAELFTNSSVTPGTFSQDSLPAPGPGSLYDLEAGDIDLDGDVDLIAASITNTADEAIVIWLNDGSGVFTELTASGASLVLPGIASIQRLSADLIDLDGDGDLDLYITGPDPGTAPNQLYENKLIP